MDSKKQIIKDTAQYTIAQYTSQGINFVYGIMLSNFLGPYFTGVWSMLKVVASYCKFNTIGTAAAAAYRLPFLKGKDDKKALEETQNSYFYFNLLGSMLTALIITLAVFIYYRFKYPQEITVGLYVIGVYAFLDKVYGSYVIFARAYKHFSALCKIMIFDAILNIVLALLLVQNFKLYGLYVAALLSTLIDIFVLRRLTKCSTRYQLNWKRIWEMAKYGFPIFIASIFSTIFFTVDRIMIAKYIGATAVGYYSLGVMARSYVYDAAQNFGTISMSHMMEAYGKNTDTKSLQKFTLVSTEVLSIIIPPILGIIYLCAPIFITYAMPKFIPGIIALQLILIDIYYRSCQPQIRHFLVAVGKQSFFIPLTIGSIVVNVCLNYTLIKIGWDINGVAAATSITSGLVFIALMVVAGRHFKDVSMRNFFIKVNAPLLYCAALVLIPFYFLPITHQIIKAIACILILTVCWIPLLIRLNKKTKVLSIIQELFLEKIKRFTGN